VASSSAPLETSSPSSSGIAQDVYAEAEEPVPHEELEPPKEVAESPAQPAPVEGVQAEAEKPLQHDEGEDHKKAA
jgi:hypothetical protein